MTWFNLVSSPDLKRVTMKVWMGKGLINRLRKKYLVLTFHQHVNRSFLPSNLIIIRREGNSRCNHETVLIRDAAKSLTRKRVSWTLESAIQRWRENVKSFRSGASVSPILINIKVSRPPRFIHLFPFFLFSLFPLVPFPLFVRGLPLPIITNTCRAAVKLLDRFLRCSKRSFLSVTRDETNK